MHQVGKAFYKDYTNGRDSKDKARAACDSTPIAVEIKEETKGTEKVSSFVVY